LLETSGPLEALCQEVMTWLGQKMVDVLSSNQQKFLYKIELMAKFQHTAVNLKIRKMALATEQNEELVMMQGLIDIAALIEHGPNSVILQAWQQMALDQILSQSMNTLQQPSLCQLQLLLLKMLEHDK
jgi:hypothetical protein